MKTNLWKLSCMALAMAAIVTGCNQNNELGTPAPSSEEDVLNVVATANDFVSSDATSRISETNYTTTFGEGDAIGVFVVRDGEALISNMKMTLGSDNVWAGENGAKLYYYKDADYIAYSPYTDGLSATLETEIVDYFTAKLEGTTGQSTLADYQAADLMTASVTAAEVTRGQNINFKFAHQMSMIEIKVPIRAYKTSGGYEYSAPLGLKVKIGDKEGFSLCTFGKETTGEAGSEVTKGIYRCIVAPSEAALTVEGEFQDGSAPVYFPATGGEDLSVTPEAGTYKGFDVNYTYDNYIATRDLQVGDYYYADGSICPGDMENIPKTGCIGIIYSTTVPDDVEADGYGNAMVLALHDLEGKINWANNITSTSLTRQYATTKDTYDQVLTDLFADKNGYTYMNEIKSKADFSLANYPAFYNVANSLQGLADISSLSTSGWYIPTIGQMADIINAFSTLASSTYVFGTSTAWNVGGIDGPTISAMLELYNRLEKVGGTWNIDRPDVNGDTNKSLRWWTSSEHSATKALSIDMNCKKFVVLDRDKNTAGSNNLYVRPVFAF